MKLLVTGGAGFIGSNFIRYWMRSHPDDKVLNLDKLTYAGNLKSLREVENNQNYEFVKGDICDPKVVKEALRGVDLVVHFAAESHVDRSILEPAVFVETNVLGTQVLLDAALDEGVKRFHHVSTDEVFGSLELSSEARFNESTPYDPRSPYSASKAGSDHLVRAYAETYQLPVTISNCSNNYGPFHFPEKLIPLAITNLIDGLKVPVYGDGLNVRDWLYVEDHCRAIEAILLRGKEGETYCIGGLTEDIPNIEVVKKIIKQFGLVRQPEGEMIEYVADRKGHDRRYAVDWSKINRELGWEPLHSFDEWLEKTIEWYRENEDWWRPLKEKEDTQKFFDKNYK